MVEEIDPTILWSGEEERDDEDIHIDLTVVDQMREEMAARIRDALDLPASTSQVADVDTDFVLMHLAYCSDYFVIEENQGDYKAANALYDLEVLSKAINEVRMLLSGTKKPAVKLTKAQKKAAKKAKHANQKAAEKMLDACELVEVSPGVFVPGKPGRMEVTIIKSKGGVSVG